ncbi:MAG: TPM domain-containing protein [Rhodothermales bacterium]|nr:TPM domain-containing protein [Rhodothermales bacterium]
MTDAARRLPMLVLLALLAASGWGQQAVPPLTGRVVDDAGILSESIERTLTDMLAAHEAATSNQVAVLTLPSLGGEPIEALALRVASAWGLGRADADNGVLLLVAVDDRELRIEVGDGLQGALTDAQASRIIRNEIVPLFRGGDYEAGVVAGVGAILGTIEGTYTPAEAPAAGEMPFWIGGLMFLLVPSLFLFFAIITPGGVRWFLFVFLAPFFTVSGFLLSGFALWGALAMLALYVVIFVGASLHPKVQALHRKMRAAEKTGSSVKVGPFTMSTSSSSSSGWSSGGSSFSGGGGSFSGGGASGSW